MNDDSVPYVMLAVPAFTTGLLAHQLAEGGLDLEVIDGGEDDGMPVLAAKPSSAVLNPFIDERRSEYKTAAWGFALAAALLVLSAWLGLGAAAITLMAVWMGYFGRGAVKWHNRWEKMRAFQGRLKEAGN